MKPGFDRETRLSGVQFEARRATVGIEGLEHLAGQANFLIGPEEEWRVGVPLYGGIVYRICTRGSIWSTAAMRQDLKSEFVVAPGADPARIRLRYAGDGRAAHRRDAARW